MSRRSNAGLQIAVAALLAGALVALGWWWASAVTPLRVAVTQQRPSESHVLAAFARVLEEQKKDIRLELVAFPTVQESGRALQQRRVDLALVRPDVFLPNNGMTVAILSEEAVVVLGRTLEAGDLAGKKLGVLVRQQDDVEVVRKVLSLYELTPAAILEPIAAANIGPALAAKTVEAVAFVAPLGALPKAELRAAYRAVPAIKLVRLDPSAASTLDSTAFEEITVPSGGLGGLLGDAEEDVATLGVSYRLMAQSAIDRGPISELTEHLFQMRQRIAKIAPAINLMAAPETETGTSAALPNHPGALDYFAREQQTFMDRYGDWVWLAVLLGGSVSSALVSARQFFARARRRREDETISHVLSLLEAARAAETEEELERISREADAIIVEAVRHAHSGAATGRATSALVLAVDAVRMALMEKRGAGPLSVRRTAMRVHALDMERPRSGGAGQSPR